jgi:uncharacterized alkaline shock family protein YloU
LESTLQEVGGVVEIALAEFVGRVADAIRQGVAPAGVRVVVRTREQIEVQYPDDVRQGVSMPTVSSMSRA